VKDDAFIDQIAGSCHPSHGQTYRPCLLQVFRRWSEVRALRTSPK